MRLVESKVEHLHQGGDTEMMEELKSFIKQNKLLSVLLFITVVSYLIAFIVSVLNLILYLL